MKWHFESVIALSAVQSMYVLDKADAPLGQLRQPQSRVSWVEDDHQAFPAMTGGPPACVWPTHAYTPTHTPAHHSHSAKTLNHEVKKMTVFSVKYCSYKWWTSYVWTPRGWETVWVKAMLLKGVGGDPTFHKRHLCDSLAWKWKEDIDRVFTSYVMTHDHLWLFVITRVMCQVCQANLFDLWITDVKVLFMCYTHDLVCPHSLQLWSISRNTKV